VAFSIQFLTSKNVTFPRVIKCLLSYIKTYSYSFCQTSKMQTKTQLSLNSVNPFRTLTLLSRYASEERKFAFEEKRLRSRLKVSNSNYFLHFVRPSPTQPNQVERQQTITIRISLSLSFPSRRVFATCRASRPVLSSSTGCPDGHT
jgi:hypothetical protein